MATCAALVAQLKILEHLLSQTSDFEKRQRILDAIDDVKQQQDAQGCLSATYTEAIGPDGSNGASVTLWTSHPAAPGPFQTSVFLHFAFPDNDPGHFDVDPFTLPVNSYTVQTTQGIGTYDAVNQLMTIDVSLHIHGLPMGDSDGAFLLSTNGSITPPDGNTYTGQFLDAQGHVTFVASTTFTNGLLDNDNGYLLVDCRLSPWPPQR